MESPITRREFIRQKTCNLMVYLKTTFPEAKFAELDKLSDDDLIKFIFGYIVPQENNLENFVNGLLSMSNINVQKVDREVKDKLIRYANFFVTMIK